MFAVYTVPVYTIWPEILVGIYFCGLMKLWHVLEFTLAVGKPYAIMIFIVKWLIRSGQELDCNDDEMWLQIVHPVV